MKKIQSDTSKVIDRKIVERNRRILMKGLCFKLASLIPHQYLKRYPKTQQDQLDLAEAYIPKLKERIEKLKMRKEEELSKSSNINGQNNIKNALINMDEGDFNGTMKLPMIDVNEFGSGIDVILVSGLQKKFMLYQVISVLQQEGAEVLSASSNIVGDKIFHTIHAQAKLSRIGVETTRIRERLQELI